MDTMNQKGTPRTYTWGRGAAGAGPGRGTGQPSRRIAPLQQVRLRDSLPRALASGAQQPWPRPCLPTLSEWTLYP
jgi:hypothetical protein